MGSREPKHLSGPTHGAVWGTIYADGAVDYDCGCHATPTPPAPADDATRRESASAEAMREACAKACRKVANGTRRPSGQSSSTLSRLSAIAEGAYMCEKAIRALPLPARREEAVVEAARAAVVRFAVEARNHGTFPVNECGVIDQTSAVYQSYIATLADLWRSVDALTAALRGANGGE